MAIFNNEDAMFIHFAISAMAGHAARYKSKVKVTEETLGVLKMLKIAVNYKRFFQKLKDEKGKTYIHRDIYEEVIKPVMDL